MGNAPLLHLLASGNLRLLGLGLTQRALAGELGALDGAPYLDITLLIEPCSLTLAIDIEGLFLGFEITATDQDHRFLLDIVAQFSPGLDVLDELGQAFRVETVRRIEELKISLVQIGDGH